MPQYVLFNKPFQVLTQFTDTEQRKTLADFISIPGIYSAGRLDYDSEGLLLLTDDGALIHALMDPKHKVPKTYYAQVEGTATERHIAQLQHGLELKDGPTLPCKAAIIEPPEWLWPRTPPIRERQNIPTSWISLTITEGKNRQVRRMTAAVGLPTLRLVRIAIGQLHLDGLESGEYRVLFREDLIDNGIKWKDKKTAPNQARPRSTGNRIKLQGQHRHRNR